MMKKILLIIIGILIINLANNAQYPVNKTRYDYLTYRYQPGDPYKPVAMGVVSFIIPGIGHLFMNEKLRGAGFFGGFMVLNLVTLKMMTEDIDFWPGIVLIGDAGIRAWSAFDAARIAKVKNLAYRDQDNTSFDFKLFPYMGSPGYFKSSKDVSAGLTLLITF